MSPIWQGLAANAFVVALVTSIWCQLLVWLDERPRDVRRIVTGLIVGTAAAAAMLFSVSLTDGIIIDVRSTILAVGVFFGGALTGVVALAIAVTMRIIIGGNGVLAGVAVMALAVCLGLGVRAGMRRQRNPYVAILVLAVALSGIGALVLLSAPFDRDSILAEVVVPSAVITFASTVLMALILQQAHRAAHDAYVLRVAMSQAPDYAYLKDRHGIFIGANRRLAAHHGLGDPREMIGLTDRDLSTPEQAEAIARSEAKVAATLEALTDLESEPGQRPGTRRWFRTSRVPILGRDGELLGIAGVSVDVTEQKRFEQELIESRDLLSLALEEMSDGLALFDPDGNLLLANEQYVRSFPRTAAVRQRGANIRTILRSVVETGEQLQVPDDAEGWIEGVVASLRTPSTEDVQLVDGRFLQIRTRVASDGNSLVVVTDVSDLRQAESVLREANSQLTTLAATDPLTGLANRRVFDEALAREVARRERNGNHLSLVMIDVDHFKAYNDLYGHPMGDACLRAVADCLRSVWRRPTDLIARYGGEEFAVIMPDTDEDGAFFTGEAFRKSLAELALEHRGAPGGKLTVSIGLAHVSGRVAAVSGSGLLAEADEALYLAKSAGRDRITGFRAARRRA